MSERRHRLWPLPGATDREDPLLQVGSHRPDVVVFKSSSLGISAASMVVAFGLIGFGSVSLRWAVTPSDIWIGAGFFYFLGLTFLGFATISIFMQNLVIVDLSKRVISEVRRSLFQVTRLQYDFDHVIKVSAIEWVVAEDESEHVVTRWEISLRMKEGQAICFGSGPELHALSLADTLSHLTQTPVIRDVTQERD